MAEKPLKYVGLVLASIHTGASINLWSNIANLAKKSQMSLFVFPGGRLENKENQEYLRNFIYPLAKSPNLDGIIAWTSTLGENDFLHGQFSALPCVSLGRKIPDCPVVDYDTYGGIQAVLQHCISNHGAKKIAFLRGPENQGLPNKRYQAYRDTLSQAGLAFDGRLVSEPFPWNEGEPALRQLIDGRALVPGKDFDTLFCSNELMMYDAGKYLQRLGVEIPRTLRLVGYNDSNDRHVLKVPSTMARMPMKQVAAASFDMVSRMLADSSFSSFDIHLPSELVVRRSCGCEYALGSEDQARATIGTKESFLAWAASIFDMKEHVEEVFSLASQPGQEIRLLPLLEHLVYRFFSGGGDPDLLGETLHWYCTFFATMEFRLNQEAKIRDMFLQQRDLVAHEQALTLSEQTKHLNDFKSALQAIRSLDALPHLLEKHLSLIGLHACYLVLLQDGAQSIFMGGYGAESTVMEAGQFPKHLMLPQRLQNTLAKGVYVLEPLFMDNQPLGYLVVGTTLFSGSVLEELRTALNSVLQGPLLLEVVNQTKGDQRTDEECASVVVAGTVCERLANDLVGREKTVVATEETLVGICNKEHPSLVISELSSVLVYEEIRKYSDVPILLLRKTWNDAEVSELSPIPRLAISHECVANSAQFFGRMKSLLGGSDLLPPLTGALVKRALLYMQQHVSEQLSRWQLSEAVSVSEDYLTRIFSKELGLSPWDYLNRFRVCLATELLRQSNLTINEIANRVGFQDQAYFCRVFRKFKGCSPTKIRQGI